MLELRLVEITDGGEKTHYTEPMPEAPKYDRDLDHYMDCFRSGVYDALTDIVRDRKLLETARKLVLFTDVQLEDELRRRRGEC